MLWLVSQQELIRVLRCEECEDQQQGCSYHRQSQQDQLCQLSPEKASIAGNISLIWKLKTICFITEQQSFILAYNISGPTQPLQNADRLNTQQCTIYQTTSTAKYLNKNYCFGEKQKPTKQKVLSNMTNYKLATSSSL